MKTEVQILREKSGMTVQELADNIGVDRATIYNYENPNYKGSPSIDVFRAIVRATGNKVIIQ